MGLAKLPRLDKVDVGAVAREIEELLVRQGRRVLFRDVQMAPAARARLREFVRFAQEGAPIAEDVVADIESALFRRAWDRDDTAKSPSFELETPLEVVIHAARARLKLAAGAPVSVAELAALASRSTQRVHQLADGRIPREHGKKKPGREMDRPLVAAEAIRWLEELGVPGFVERTTPKRGDVAAPA
jgi:hypothetical protein